MLHLQIIDTKTEYDKSRPGVESYNWPETLIPHYSKSKRPFQLILALYSPKQKAKRWHRAPTVLRGLSWDHQQTFGGLMCIVHIPKENRKTGTSYLAFRVRTKIILSIKPIWNLKFCDDEVLFYVGLLLKREICDRNLLLFFVILHLDKPN